MEGFSWKLVGNTVLKELNNILFFLETGIIFLKELMVTFFRVRED